jgi:hypothetical protein
VKPLPLLIIGMALGCAGLPGTAQPSPISVWVRSNNRSPVDVYLLCGQRQARHLGVVTEKGRDLFEVPGGQPFCAWGLNFFLVVRNSGRGYWVGPFRPSGPAQVDLAIGKYAGLSQASVRPWR